MSEAVSCFCQNGDSIKFDPLKIGKLKIKTPLVLAPMCDVTCNAFRLLCMDYGAGLVYSPKLEEAKFRMDRENFDDFLPNERPVGAQVIGDDPENLRQLIEAIGDKVDTIDLNAGCSKRNYIKMQWGGWLSSNPKKLSGILSKLRGFTDKPLTVKVRLGSNRKSPEIFETLKLCEDAGIDAISIHGRFVMHNYVDDANWSTIKKVKEAANIPVIANGDVFSADDAVRMFDETGCDGVMMGRGAIGNPFIFRDTKLAMAGKVPPKEHSLAERMQAFFEFVDYYKKYNKEPDFKVLKTHAIWFAVAAPGTRKLRVQIQTVKNEKELMALLDTARQE